MKTKRMVSYRDSEVIKNGTTTIVYGDIVIKTKGQLREDMISLVDTSRNLLGGGVGRTKGVSKLHPEDVYDEKTGKIVASKKGEMQGLRASKKVLADYVANLEKVLAAMKTQVALVEARYESLEKDEH